MPEPLVVTLWQIKAMASGRWQSALIWCTLASGVRRSFGASPKDQYAGIVSNHQTPLQAAHFFLESITLSEHHA